MTENATTFHTLIGRLPDATVVRGFFSVKCDGDQGNTHALIVDLLIAFLWLSLLYPLWLYPVVHGIRAAKRVGASPNWMWFGIHPLFGWLAFGILQAKTGSGAAADTQTVIHGAAADTQTVIHEAPADTQTVIHEAPADTQDMVHGTAHTIKWLTTEFEMPLMPGFVMRFRHGKFWGKLLLTVNDVPVPFANLPHLDPRLTRSWGATVSGSDLRIEITRPLVFAGWRKGWKYVVFLDGKGLRTFTDR